MPPTATGDQQRAHFLPEVLRPEQVFGSIPLDGINDIDNVHYDKKYLNCINIYLTALKAMILYHRQYLTSQIWLFVTCP